MKSSRYTVLLIGLTVLTLSAGVVTGLLAAKLPTVNNASPAIPLPVSMDRSLTDQLQLSSEQQIRMREIWESARGNVQETFQDAQGLQQLRDQAIAEMLSDEQKAKFSKIALDFSDRYEKLTRKRDSIFKNAVAETNKILDDTQKRKYEEILSSRVHPSTRP